MQHADFDLTLHLSMFDRDAAGTPMYSRGLMPKDVAVHTTIHYEQPELQLTPEEVSAVNARYAAYLNSAAARHNYAVLLDNDDAFLRNFIAPHAFGILNQMLTDTKPMLFTQDISPPPCRLNFPFLVGRHEQELISDLETYLEQYFTAGLHGLKFSVRNVAFTPDLTVVVEI